MRECKWIINCVRLCLCVGGFMVGDAVLIEKSIVRQQTMVRKFLGCESLAY